MTWNSGDRVKVKTGGPPMTVEHENEDMERVQCVWFEGDKMKRELFHPAALEAAGPPDLPSSANPPKR